MNSSISLMRSVETIKMPSHTTCIHCSQATAWLDGNLCPWTWMALTPSANRSQEQCLPSHRHMLPKHTHGLRRGLHHRDLSLMLQQHLGLLMIKSCDDDNSLDGVCNSNDFINETCTKHDMDFYAEKNFPLQTRHQFGKS